MKELQAKIIVCPDGSTLLKVEEENEEHLEPAVGAILQFVEGEGLPLRWQDEQSGRLPDAVMAFFAHQTNRTSEFTSEQLVLVRAYLAYYIHAPCWEHGEEPAEELQALRKNIGALSSSQQLADWILECLELGIDPL